jgi:hypothetical protein
LLNTFSFGITWVLGALAFREAQQVGVNYRTAHTPADSFGSFAGCFYVFSYVPHS